MVGGTGLEPVSHETGRRVRHDLPPCGLAQSLHQRSIARLHVDDLVVRPIFIKSVCASGYPMLVLEPANLSPHVLIHGLLCHSGENPAEHFSFLSIAGSVLTCEPLEHGEFTSINRSVIRKRAQE